MLLFYAVAMPWNYTKTPSLSLSVSLCLSVCPFVPLCLPMSVDLAFLSPAAIVVPRSYSPASMLSPSICFLGELDNHPVK